ncbi:SMI1/KNR4 family protein [Streptomyces sp. STR69]|uniref:SMI1/KNR4 family protein n=1 Tax=Streptomyces sp. STR69 TaxID=1796942 RepID=UPI0021C87874|nr:SMI1/KNR4 family protein [Streptomyces sp. STR69]
MPKPTPMPEPRLDVSVALRGGVTGRAHAWGFLRRFADEWTGLPLQPEDGCTAAELDAAEAELGFRFPAALREGYALLGRRDDLTRQQDPLLPPSALRVVDDFGGVLVFRHENQGCASWGVRLNEIEQDDPPVVMEAYEGWVPFLDRLSVAWVELVLSESLLGAGSLYDACELPDGLLPDLRARYTRVDLPDHPLWASAACSPLRWYAAPGRLLRRDGVFDHSWVHARGRTAADLETIRADLPGPWVVG